MKLDSRVIASEFPNLQLNSNDGKKVVLTFENGKNVIISKENDNGDYDSEIYEFSNEGTDDKTVWPDTPELPDYLAKLDLDTWNGIVDNNFRDDYNDNIKQTQETVNSVVGYVIDQHNFFDKLKTTFSDFKGFVEKVLSIKFAQYMHDNIEVKYYDKTAADEKFNDLQKQINNLSNAVNYKPQPNSVFPPGFTGKKDIDINDTIHDQNVKNKVETLNDIDEKGE